MKTYRILIVEDMKDIALYIAQYLERLGYEVEAVGSAEDALRREDLEGFDLYLIDIGLPCMNGIELVSILRGLKIKEPVVIVTGYGDTNNPRESRYVVDASKLGVRFFLSKPYNAVSLSSSIQGALVKKMQEKEYVKNEMAYIRKHKFEDVINYLLPYKEEIYFEFMSILDILAEIWERQTVCLSCQIGCGMG